MSEMRQDILTGEWVLYASVRDKRPHDFMKTQYQKRTDIICPFCPGNETNTTETLDEMLDADGKWTVRAFSNRYPAVSQENSPFHSEVLYQAKAGYGIHEVLVDTNRHEESMSSFTKMHFYDVFSLLKRRYEKMAQNENILYIQIFKNYGPSAGASLSHSHWQILGLPVLPKEQADQEKNANDFYQRTGSCVYCQIMEHEQKERRRIVCENSSFIVFAPYASKMGYELQIMPKFHVPHYHLLDKFHLEDLSDLFYRIMPALESLNPQIHYNICFQDSRLHSKASACSHFYIRLFPRMGTLAGFEFATKSFINPILPEKAAIYYKEKIAQSGR